MTMVTLPGTIAWPGIVPAAGTGWSGGTTTNLTAAGHYQAYVYAANQDMVISHVGYKSGGAVGSPVADIRIETVDASGFPSGTLWATNTNVSSGTLTGNTDGLAALTASATITKGQVFCVKFAYSSGTSFNLTTLDTNMISNSTLPYKVLNTGTPTRGTINGETPAVYFGSSSTTFYCMIGSFPWTNIGGGTFNNTNSARRGLRFTIPFKARAVGLRWYNGGAIGDYNVALYNDAGTELSSSLTAYDGDHTSATNSGIASAYFDNNVLLTAGTTYRLSIEPTTATNAAVYTHTLPSANARSATPAGTGCHYTTFATGAWTDTSTSSLPVMDLLIDQLDDGAGGGGSVVGVIGG